MGLDGVGVAQLLADAELLHAESLSEYLALGGAEAPDPEQVCHPILSERWVFPPKKHKPTQKNVSGFFPPSIPHPLIHRGNGDIRDSARSVPGDTHVSCEEHSLWQFSTSYHCCCFSSRQVQWYW